MDNFVCLCMLLLILTFLTIECNSIYMTSNALTHLVDAGSKQYFISTYESDFNGARIGCQFNGMIVGQLETKCEYDILISTFENLTLPNRVYIGLSLKAPRVNEVLIGETERRIPYKVKFHPGNPDGDGLCLEILRQNRVTALNDLSCTRHRLHFICEKDAPPPTPVYKCPPGTHGQYPNCEREPIPYVLTDSTTTSVPNTTVPSTTTQLPLKCYSEAELTNLLMKADRKCDCDYPDIQVRGPGHTASASNPKTEINVTDENAYNSEHMAVFDLITGYLTFKNRKTGKSEFKEARLDLVTNKIILKTSETHTDTDTDLDHIQIIRVVYRKIDSSSGYVVVKVIDLKDLLFDRKTQQIWVFEVRHESTGNAIYTTTQVNAQTGFIITSYGFLNVKTSNIDIISSVESKITRFHWNSMQIMTDTGEIDTEFDVPIYVINEIDVVSGEVYEIFVKVDRYTDRMIFIKIRFLMQKDENGLPSEMNYESVTIDPITRRVQMKMVVKTTFIYRSYQGQGFDINFLGDEELKNKTEQITERSRQLNPDASETVYTVQRETVWDGTSNLTDEQLLANSTKIITSPQR